MKSETEIRNKIKELEDKKKIYPKNSETYDKWIEAMAWILNEYCDGLDCGWCSNTVCINV